MSYLLMLLFSFPVVEDRCVIDGVITDIEYNQGSQYYIKYDFDANMEVIQFPYYVAPFHRLTIKDGRQTYIFEAKGRFNIITCHHVLIGDRVKIMRVDSWPYLYIIPKVLRV